MPTYDYKLVRLPKVKGIEKDFYGIGYYSPENGEFIFAVLTSGLIETQPLRSIHPKEWGTQSYESELKVIGSIENLP